MDEMGPVAAKSYPGHQLARVAPQSEPRRPAQRARQEIDYGRRDKGYVFGAFRPVTGEALTKTYGARSTLNWVDFRVPSVARREILASLGLSLPPVSKFFHRRQ